MGNTPDERRKRRQAWALKIKAAFRDIDKLDHAVPFKYAALEIQKLLPQENLPSCDVYEMIAEDMYRERFSVSGRSRILYWEEDVAQKITSENFERVLIPIIDALDNRGEAIKFLVDRCWTRWEVLDRWCDKNKLPRIERWMATSDPVDVPEINNSAAAPRKRIKKQELQTLIGDEFRLRSKFNQKDAGDFIKEKGFRASRDNINKALHVATGGRGPGRPAKNSQI